VIRRVRPIDLPTEAHEPDKERSGELGLDRAVPAQATPDRGPVVSGDEVGDRSAIARQQDDQVGVEPVPHPGCFTDQILAGLDEKTKLGRLIGQPDRGQVRLPCGHPGNREGITGIALAWSPDPPAL
jgi:hypothetical protein